MEETNLPSRREKSLCANIDTYPLFCSPKKKIQYTLARYREIHVNKNPIQKVHTMYLRSPIIIKLHYTTNKSHLNVPIQWFQRRESPPRRKNPPLDPVHSDRPEPCSFITPGFRVYTLFWEPAFFQQKPNFSSQESRPFFSLFLSLLSSHVVT